ncbi:MAG: intracellular sulfur oxidation DsrE/DsrF family protein [Arcticibacterium sp.]|jgi:intracellular sulfur oxidation DsrE/DsrF family protein|tara:strand:+ start:7111 stop:7650 length:540 start_codon:yes stop_codon:yes gene_type:complete
MKKQIFLSLFILLFFTNLLQAQNLINPVIKGFGTIGDAPEATEKPDPNMDYKIIVDLMTGEEEKSELSFSLNNVARLINLHVMGGVPKEKITVVVAIHASAIWSAMNNEAHKKAFSVENPNIPLLKELINNGVKIVVCSQSMFKRKIAPSELAPGLEIATSALTVLSTYQLKGYALIRF